MKENVYLVDLGTGTDRSLLPLAAGLISSYSRNIPELEEHYDFDIRMLGAGMDEVFEELRDPAVIGVSCYVWNFSGSAELSRRWKERFPNAWIVWGGPAVPSTAERIPDFLDRYPWVDVLVHGEGEQTFAEILRRRLRGEDLSGCAGVTFRSGDAAQSLVTTPPRDRIKDFSVVPSPFLNGTFDVLLDRYGDHIVGALWETSRGCPFKCTFCDWGSALVNKVNRIDQERAVREIQWVSDRKMHYVYATDANFGIFRDRDLGLARSIVDISSKNGFPNTLVLNWTKNSGRNVLDIAEILSSGGVTTNTTLSFQSFHEPTLKAIKRDNIKLGVYQELKNEYHSRKLPTYTELIFPLPEETLETFALGIEAALTSRMEDQLSIYPLVLLENTELASSATRERYELDSRKCAVGLNRRKFKYDRFGEDEIVVGTSTMPLEAWKKAYEIAFSVCSLYNLRVSFFLMLYLKHEYGLGVVEFVQFLLDAVDRSPAEFPALREGIEHVRNNRSLILDNVASVSAPAGGDGVALTPHEAMTFLLLNRMEETYSELKRLALECLRVKGHPIDVQVLDEVVLYQKMRMPVFEPPETSVCFETTVPHFFLEILDGRPAPGIEKFPTIAELDFKPHAYKTEREFNLRRVACGYTLNLATTVVKDGWLDFLEVDQAPAARNTNLETAF